MVEQAAAVAGIFAKNVIAFFQDVDSSVGEVGQIANRCGNEIEHKIVR